MSYTASKSLSSNISGGKIGNGPYALCSYKNISCTVDIREGRSEWYCTNTLYQKIELTKIGKARGSEVTFWCESLNGYDMSCVGGSITWSARNGHTMPWEGSIDSDSGWHQKSGYIFDIRQVLGNTFKSHTWYNVTARWYYFYCGYAHTVVGGWQPVNTNTQHYSTSVPILTPRVVGGNHNNWRGNASRGSVYAYRSVYVSANYSGLIQGNESHTVIFKVNGTTIGSQTNKTSGTIGGYYYVSGIGNKNWSITCDGYTIASGTWYFQEPPPTKPTMGAVNNTTATSINTTQRKTISGNWGVSDVGWPQGSITYNWECYYGSTLIKSGETGNTSTSFTYDIPTQHTGADIYFRVRARQNSNSLGYSGWTESGRVTIFWAYNEPAKVQAVSLNPVRYQLFYGNKTAITTTATMKINGWGDRPGTRNVEFRMINATKNQHVAWFGRNNTSNTGNLSQSLTATVPDNALHDTYQVWAHKRIGDTEYLASNDARYPATGTNNVKVGDITFYEVKGRISGSFTIDPDVVISGLPSAINYTWTYDRQSSNKVDIYIEVYDMANEKVTKTINFETGVNESKTITNRRSNLVLIEAQKAGAYEVRLKAKITELLGDVTTHTLATIQPENYNPPIPHIGLNHLTKPLPTNKAASLLAKQATDIIYDYDYSFEGVDIKSVEIEMNSKPYGKQIYSVPYSDTTSPYYNTFTRASTGDFTLDSTVSAILRVYYAIRGDNRVWIVESDKLNIKITHTRYMFYYTTTELGEKQMIQMRYLNNNSDQVLRKIHIDD